MSKCNEESGRETLGHAVEAYVEPSSIPNDNEWWTRRHDDILDQVKMELFTLIIVGEPFKSRETEVQKLQELVSPADQPIFEFVASELADPVHHQYTNKTLEDHKIRSATTDLSQYHSSMVRFCESELSCNLPCEDYFKTNIFLTAAVARMSFACLWSLRNGHYDDLQHSAALTTLDTLRNGNCQPNIPTIQNPCPWLEDSAQDHTTIDTAGDLPRYLWDIEAQKTVTVATLRQTRIEYAIVSHTWGRWRKSGNGARVAGVDLWRVPENTQFDVTQLPAMLKAVGFAEKYVWFDLFCIPQDCLDDKLVEECNLEVARQAKIFRHAKTSVAWLNDIEHWDQLQATLPWFGIRWLMKTTSSPHWFNGIEISLEVARRLASDSCGLLVGQSRNLEERLPGWFSSLWTLQECLIRPDMVLVSKAWTPLTIGHVLPITIDDLAALVCADSETVYENLDDYKPPAANELDSCLSKTGMIYITSKSRLKSLIMGRSRVCINSRAEAIMSVAGATDWYVGKTFNQFREIRDHKETDLVCGLYPLDFVNELRRKIGPSFFMCVHEARTVDWVENGDDDAMERAVLKGSMLPFTLSYLNDGTLYRTFIHDAGYPGHPAVDTWIIQSDGSVLLPQVGILATNLPNETNKHAHMLAATYIFGNDPTGLARRSGNTMEVDLISYIRKFNGEAVAICTMQARCGIIIQRPERGHKTFAKAGVFQVINYDKINKVEIPRSTEVNWLVI